MAQELYDGQGKKIITYPRAEVRYLPQSLISDVPKIVAGLQVGQSFSAIPAAARAWVGVLATALAATFVLGSHEFSFHQALGITAVAAVGISGVLRLADWSLHQIRTLAVTDGNSEEAQQLLKEY